MLGTVKDKLRVAMANNEYVAKVAEATNEDPWGPTGPQMEELSQIFGDGRVEIVGELQYRLENRKESWRKCYKSLLLIDHLVRNMPDVYIDDIRALAPLIHEISTRFNFVDERGVDHGLSVRERAKKVYELLSDERALREAREAAEKTRFKCAGIGSGPGIGMPTTGTTNAATSSVPRPGSSRPTDVARSAPAGTTTTTMSSGFAGASNPASRADRLRQEQEMQDHMLAMKLQAEEEARAAAAATRGGSSVSTGRGVTHVTAPQHAPLRQHVVAQPVIAPQHVPDDHERMQIEEDHRIALALSRGEDPFAGRSSAPTRVERAPQPQPQPQPQQARQDALSFLDNIGAPMPVPSTRPVGTSAASGLDFFSQPIAVPPPQPQQPAPGSHQGIDLFTSQPFQPQPFQPQPQARLDLFSAPPPAPQPVAAPTPAAFDPFATPPRPQAPSFAATQPQAQPQAAVDPFSFFVGGPSPAVAPQQGPTNGRLEQQVAAFSGQRQPAVASREKTLDEILAERRQGPSW